MKLFPGKRVRTGKIKQTQLERHIYYYWWWWEAVAVVGERQLHKPFVGSGKPHGGGPWSLSLAETFSQWQWWGERWLRTMNRCVAYSHSSMDFWYSRVEYWLRITNGWWEYQVVLLIHRLVRGVSIFTSREPFPGLVEKPFQPGELIGTTWHNDE